MGILWVAPVGRKRESMDHRRWPQRHCPREVRRGHGLL